MSNREVMPDIRFFISFSSHDKPAVREIMSGLRSQHFDFWDYSNEIEEMKFTDEVRTRLKEEIDKCDYFIAFVSKHSTSEENGHFTRYEVQHAVNELKLHQDGRIFIIELEDARRSDYIGPYEPLKGFLHIDFIWDRYNRKNVQSYISILKKICQAAGREYIPQITPHPRLPFWERFRDEVISFVHTNSTHVHLNSILGEFNEYFRIQDYSKAYHAIQYFIVSCNYLIPDYKLVYPWIVKAVTEHELGKHPDAKISYEEALVSEPDNPIALGGIGMVYHMSGDYVQAVNYFQKAVLNSQGIQAINERLNLVVSKLSGQLPLSSEEQIFVRNLNPDLVVEMDRKELIQKGILPSENEQATNEDMANRFEEQRQRIFLAKALSYYCEATESQETISRKKYLDLLETAYDIYKYQIPEESIFIAAHITYFYLTARNLNKLNPAEILHRALERPDPENKMDKRFLYEYLAEHYTYQKNPFKSIIIYEEWLINDHPGKRTLIFYALALRIAGRSKYKEICKSVLDTEKSGLPATREDFYWNGFANYLLENTSRAYYDYERSNHYMKYYSEIFNIST